MRTILVDDEPDTLKEIKAMVEKHGKLEIVGVYIDPWEAIKEITLTEPDCALLDIEMVGMNGIELAEQLLVINPKIELLFITAYNNYAAQAFEVNATDYILKPVRQERIDKALDKLLKNRKNRLESNDTSCSIRFFGGFEVIIGNNPIRWNRSKTKELLAFLLQHEGRWLTKYRICDELWPKYEPDKALAYLHTSIWALRKGLNEAGCTSMKVEFAGDRYILRQSNADWDLRQFEKQYQIFIQSHSLDAAKKAVQCYSGEYLEGEDWLWADIPRVSYTLRFNELPKEVKTDSRRKGTK